MAHRPLARLTATARPLAVLLAVLVLSSMPAAPLHARVLVLGFDGADARLTEQYLKDGFLPNLARLRDTGCYSQLGTTLPPQTPVSWSAFATGMNPGKNGIFDFLRRDLATYQPDFAMYRIGSEKVLWGRRNKYLVALGLAALGLVAALLVLAATRHSPRRRVWSAAPAGLGVLAALVSLVCLPRLLPYERPTVTNLRRGETFWEAAGRHGRRSTVVRVPATFPAQAYEAGHLLSGLGVPDIRGTFGTFSYYTTESLPERVDANTEMGGKIVPVSLLDGRTESLIYGPRNRPYGDTASDVTVPVTFQVDRQSTPHRVTVTTCGQTRSVAQGEWSDWFRLEFAFSPLLKAYGIARFYFVASEPFGLYMSAVNLDPHRPPLPISAPPDLARDLAHRFGTYKTLGWSMDTWALNELRIDEKTFLEDVYATEGKFGEIMKGLLDDGDFDLFVQCFELNDRVAHVFWRLLDPQHPAYDAALAAIYGNAVRDTYVFMDRMVGVAMAHLRPDDLLLVCSDHGFHTWHKSANYNTWLVHHGYMSLASDAADPEKRLEDLFGRGQFWPNVEWRRTKAYALGLGDLYLNVKGREAKGIVLEGDEYERIRTDLVRDLLAWTDPENGEHPVRRVTRREDIYSGYDPDVIPDLLISNNPGYRVSWQTSLGGIPRDELQVNKRKWSGDHCSLDPEITKGILFANRPLDLEGVSMVDLFPTILEGLGVPLPDSLDGRSRLTGPR